jgi:nucleoside-diphosphate-sugar epimerase
MDVLVLGGTAWLGREVARAALARGHDVTVLARGRSGPPPEGVRHVPADRTEAGAYDDVRGRDWDAVVDVARQPGQVRSAVTALADRARHWVLVSSCSVYARDDRPGEDESAALLPAVEEDSEDPHSYGGRKVACEAVVLEALGDRALVARAGLVGGPGDTSDRTGYWPLRFAHPATDDGTVLVPDSTNPTQVVDVRDLADWLVRSGEGGATGVANAAGPVVPLPDHLAVARSVAGHTGATVPVSSDWLQAHRVEPWMGERSLPLWLPMPDYAGHGARDTGLARRLGLSCRPLADTLADTLAWELRHGPGRARRAGLSPTEERELLQAATRGTQDP